MEEEIKKQEVVLTRAQSQALSDCGPEGQIVRAVNRATQAILLLSRIVNRWSTEAYNRADLDDERRAR